MTEYIVYFTVWSDGNNDWYPPKRASIKYSSMGERIGKPVIYFTTDDKKKSEDIVKALPNTYEMGNRSVRYEFMEKWDTLLFFGHFPVLY